MRRLRLRLSRRAVPIAAAGLILGMSLTAASAIASSRPGDLSYGIREAVEELRTALASDGEARSSRYMDEVDATLAELHLLVQNSAPAELVEKTAERAITEERHAHAELSAGNDFRMTDRCRRHHRVLTDTLRSAKRPADRKSVQDVLKVLPPPGPDKPAKSKK